MSLRRASLTAYARAVERALSRARGAPVVVSERDFALVRSWHERGVPLAVVLEALRGAEVRGKVPRSLAFVAGSVEEAWTSLAEGRVGTDPSVAPAAGGTTEAAWRARRDAADPGSPLRVVLDRAIGRVERGDDPAAIDATIDDELVAGAPADLRARCLAGAERALAGHRDRMPADVFARTLRRSFADRLREALGVARLGSGARREDVT